MIGVWMDSYSNGPGTNPHFYRTWRITPALHSLKQEVVGDVTRILWVVMTTIGLVLLIACTNIANLLMVRAESRQQELSIRAALGAGRARIARELLIESVSWTHWRRTGRGRGRRGLASSGRYRSRPSAPPQRDLS